MADDLAFYLVEMMEILKVAKKDMQQAASMVDLMDMKMEEQTDINLVVR